MKRTATIGMVFLAGIAGEVGAACLPTPGGSVTLIQPASAILSTLENKTVCGRPGPAYPGGGVASPDRWQEEHVPGGELWDYKLGPGNTVDPRQQVGTWSAIGSGFGTIVTYAYTGGNNFSYSLFRNGFPPTETYSFCTGVGGAVVVEAFLLPIGGGCGGSFPP